MTHSSNQIPLYSCTCEYAFIISKMITPATSLPRPIQLTQLFVGQWLRLKLYLAHFSAFFSLHIVIASSS